MKNLTSDLGFIECKLHDKGGPLQFNPTDPNIGFRYEELVKYVEDISPEYEKKFAQYGNDYKTMFKETREMDLQLKEKLAYTFGSWNDFDAIFMGLHFMSLGNNGQPILANFLEKINPLITKEISGRAKKLEEADAEVKAAKTQQAQNRAQRRAANKQ